MPSGLGIRTKLLIGFSAIVLFVIFTGLVGIYNTWRTARAFHRVVTENASALEYLLEIKSMANEIEAQTMSFELLEEESTVAEGTPGGEKKFALLEKVEKIQMWTEKYRQAKLKDKTSADAMAPKIREAQDRVVIAALEFVRLKEQSISGGPLLEQKTRLENARGGLKGVVQKAVDEELGRFHEQQIEADLSVSTTFVTNAAATVLALIVALSIGGMLSNQIAKPVLALQDTALGIARGDLTRRGRIFSSDEIGDLTQSFNAMADKVQQEIQRRIQGEVKFRSVVEASPHGVLTVNEEGNIVLVNSQLEKMFGYTRQELLNRKIEMLVPKRYRSRHEEDRRGYFQSPRARAMGAGLDLYGLHKDGREFPVDISLSPIETSEGKIVLATVTDLTERKHIQQALLQSEKLSAVGQLAGGVAHEINNPLGVILGFSQMAAKQVKPGDPLELPLKSIEREAIRCRNLVQDLLTFSRVGKTEKESLDLKGAIESALSLILAQTKVKKVDLVKEFEDVPKMVANKNQIQQIIVNLSNNAIDAMPEGGRLTVRLRKARMEKKEAVEIQVEDTGGGIPPDIRSKIFNPFFTTKEIGKGTGLGLALVHEIVQKHNGRILFESEAGKGTTFQVILPLEGVQKKNI